MATMLGKWAVQGPGVSGVDSERGLKLDGKGVIWLEVLVSG